MPPQTHGIVAVVGFPERADDVYNAAAVLADGVVAAVYRKMYLPNYGVFDEHRYFQTGSEAGIFELNGGPSASRSARTSGSRGRRRCRRRWPARR